jgi:hypothetical protein
LRPFYYRKGIHFITFQLYSKPPPNYSPEELDEDETLDIKILDYLVSEFITILAESEVPDEMLRKIIKIVRSGTDLYSTPFGSKEIKLPTIPKIEFKDLWSDTLRDYSLGNDIIPVQRIKFANRCIYSLFQFCNQSSPELSAHSSRIARAALPTLLDKCRLVMVSYIADRPLLGKMPIPRYLFRLIHFSVYVMMN